MPWQTYVHSSMGAHTLQPTGLVLRLGLSDVSGAPSSSVADLGPGGHIAPWPRFSPAHVLPGRHSLNGSDYTSFVVRGWGRDPGEGEVGKGVNRVKSLQGRRLVKGINEKGRGS